MELPLWLKIILFIVFIIVTWVGSYLILYKLFPRINKISNPKIKIIAIQTVPSFISTALFLLVGIWILTLYFIWQLFLILITINIIPVLFVGFFIYNLDEDDLLETNIVAIIQANEKPIISMQTINGSLRIAGILLYILTGIIYFGLNVSMIIQIKLFIVLIYFIGFPYLIIRLILSLIRVCSPYIETLTRKNYIIGSIITIFQLSFVFSLILWLFDIGLFTILVDINNIIIYWFYLVLLISILIFLFAALLFSSGEKQRKNKELKVLRKKENYLTSLRNKINPSDIAQSRENIEAINDNFSQKNNRIKEIMDPKLSTYLHPDNLNIFESYIVDIKKDDYEDISISDYISNIIWKMWKYHENQIEFFRSMIEKINNVISNIDQAVLTQFKNEIKEEIKSNSRAIEDLKKRKTFLWRNTAVLLFFWTIFSGFLNIGLYNILELVILLVG